MQIKNAGGVALVAALSIAAGTPTTSTHEEGVLKLPSAVLTAGTTVRLTGEQFTKGGRLKLVLVGVSGRSDVAEVRADSAGRFTNELSVPGNLAAGAYRLVAIASDGDEVGALDVEVVFRAADAPAAAESHEGHASPTAEPLPLARAKSPLVTGGALITIVLALTLGGTMLYRNRHTNTGWQIR